MDISQIVKNSNDFNLLLQEIKDSRLANAILLESKDNTYTFEFAKMVASVILNNDFIENDVLDRIKLNSHPDVKIYPQKDKLLVADSQEIVDESYALPIAGDKKVFIIKDIDVSTDSAQNKLLKILEEPPKYVYMILTCSNFNLVLPTIRSRCNKYSLQKPNKEQIKSFVEGKENSQLISCLCDGYVGRAEKLSQIKELPKIFESAISVLTKLKSTKEVLAYSSELLKYKEQFDLIIEILSLAIEDLLAIKQDKGNLIKLSIAKSELESIADQYSLKLISQLQNVLNKAVKEKLYNVNITLIIENLLINILEVKFLCK